MARRSFDLFKSSGGSIIDMKTGKSISEQTIPVICERIRHYRNLIGKEQKAMAAEIGVSANAVSNWENGRTRPDVNLLPRICEALDITFYQLYDLPEPGSSVTAGEQLLVDQYRSLRPAHKRVVESTAVALDNAEIAEACPSITRLLKGARSLAAGIGDPTEWEDDAEPAFLYSTALIDRADYIFEVNGDSMEPEYHDGDCVLIQRITDGNDLEYGEVGAFMTHNELYIKVFEEDGLHSYNPRYKTMKFDDEDAVYLIGRVIGIVEDTDFAKPEDVEKYYALHPEEES